MVGCLLSVCLMLTGCSLEEAESMVGGIEENMEMAVSEPQSNTRDYLLQDYNVKEPKDVTINSLSKFDVSGPDYTGISESVSNLEAAEDTEDLGETANGVCISTYHEKKHGSSNRAGDVCVTREYGSDVLSALKGTDFYTEGSYNDSSNGNDVLADAITYLNGTAQSEKTDRDRVRAAIAMLEHDKKVAAAYSCTTSENYSVETNACAKLKSALSKAGAASVVTDSSLKSGLAFNEMAEYASSCGAAVHVVISYNEVQVGTKQTDGWAVYYREPAGGNADSQALAEAVSKALKSSGLQEASSTRSGNGLREVGSYYDNVNKFVVLNYATVPTVVISLGITDKNSKDIATGMSVIADALASFGG